ncbi:MAG TPA: hypothetical protein VJ623_00035 [Holophagaceae bacterium]|nr:hypothetical protein [Holophagaceae bacterium]
MGTSTKTARPGVDRRFYTAMGLLAAAIILLGFGRTYYLKAAFGTPGLTPLVHLHGLVMTTWFLLFIVQAKLVADRRVDLHRKLGMVGALVALAVLVVGPWTAITAARLGHAPPGPPPLVFLVVPIGDMVVFATLVGAGLWYRSRPDVHRRLMLLSCIGMLTAAIARIPLDVVAKAGVPLYFGLTDLFVLGCLFYDRVKTGRFHPAFVAGSVFVILSHPARLMFAGTALWMKWAHWMVG